MASGGGDENPSSSACEDLQELNQSIDELSICGREIQKSVYEFTSPSFGDFNLISCCKCVFCLCNI